MKRPSGRLLLARLKNVAAAPLPPAPVLLTGASGRIGTWSRPTLRAAFPTLRLTDAALLPRAEPVVESIEQFRLCNLVNAENVSNIVRGVGQIVHLGAVPTEGPIEQLSPTNVNGVTHLFDAAIAHGVRRVVLISSLHVLGRYRRDEPITTQSRPRPDGNYGLTKLYAEELARHYHERYGISVVVIRPGHVIEHKQKSEPNNWVNPDDLARLMVVALKAENIGYEIWHAVTDASADDPSRTDLATRFGFHFSPSPDLGVAPDEALKRWYGDDEVARIYRGGIFASGRLRR